jgi:hypothetical protein
MLADWNAPAVASARTLARALDAAERKADGYLIARLSSELRQMLDGLGWLPEKAGDHDDIDSLLALLSGPALGHPT